MAPRTLPLAQHELAAIADLIGWARSRAPFDLVRALLFGSRARGDHDAGSDIDVLLVFAADDAARTGVARSIATRAHRIRIRTGVPLQAWTLGLEDLAVGRRTPMLVDAVADALPIWPGHTPVPALPFTPADAAFCADRLLGWVARGGWIARRALSHGNRTHAARRIRDDVTRLATAALLLTGDTRHRRQGSLRRFEETFLGYGSDWDVKCLPALGWALAAYPPDGGRGDSRPPPSTVAAATTELGLYFRDAMCAAVVPWVRQRASAMITQSSKRDGRRP